MKISRHKKVRRILNFYRNNFQFRFPYQLLIDATFCQEALKCKINIHEQVRKYLEDSGVRLYTTPCVIMEAEALGSPVYGAMLIVKQFLIRKCGHEKNPLPASDCLLSMTENGNPDHYILATQDRELSEKVRLIPGIPLLYISHNAINLEKPSVVNKETIQVKMQEKLKSSDYQNAVLNKLKRDIFGDDDEPKRKKKKIKGPNPLSCKKKKERSVAPQNEKIKKRKRHKRSKNKEVHVSQLLSCLE